MEQSGESGESDSEMSEEDPDRPDPSASPPRAKKQEQQERRHVVDNESGVALLLETRRGRRPRRGRNTTVRAWRFGNLVWEYKIRGRVEHTAVAEGFVAFATRAALHLLSTVGGYLLFPPMVLDSPVLQLDIRAGGFLVVLGQDSGLRVVDLRGRLLVQTVLRHFCELPALDYPARERACTATLFEEAHAAPAIGGLVLTQALHEFTLPPEVVLYEPSAHDIHRGGAPLPEGKTGNRLIFLNVPLLDFEQKALQSLHDALKDEKALAPEGDGVIPSYVRLHALRILQQSKLRVDKALSTIATHLEMRVQKMPVHEESVLADLKSGMMYWHGRDRSCRPVLIWRMEKISKFDADRATRMILFILEFAVRYLMVPGRVENWVLIVDLAGCGLSMAAASSFRTVCRNVTRLLEEVYCGRNFTTKIFHMPSIVRAIVNSLIPEDKKSKVDFVADADIAKSMRLMCEPHQLEEQYGGTAPNVREGEAFPFRFFPHCRGPKSGGSPPLPSLHDVADRSFHEGFSLDLFEKAQAIWRPFVAHQPLTKIGAETVSKLLAEKVAPTETLDQWLALQSPDAAGKYTAHKVSAGPAEAQAPAAEPDPVSPTLSNAETGAGEAAESNEMDKDQVEKEFGSSLVIKKDEVFPILEEETKAACCVCSL
ncbi:unnamed protein product [Symbiodinium natans]|uniref:CRAL-TRIO domain-containing protein n=1 Tax=Symbiodinium natans TaxID=878477 RepID=A0A812QVE0_9DINO|nr:unnamed protein product [Symbiodinium natans]